MAKKKEVRVWDFVEPVENTLVVTEPQAVGKQGEVTRESGIIELAPDDVIAATYGVVVKVLRVHEELAERFPVGSSLLVHEHGGHPIWSGNDTRRAYVIVEGDVIAKVASDYWKHYGSPEN